MVDSGTMRGVFYLGPGNLELREVPIPSPQAGELLVKVNTALTCGTDLKTFRRGHPKFPPPFLMGHEFAGNVVAMGTGVEQFKPGMRVTANVFAPCMQCYYCLHGQDNLCEQLHYNFGAFAEYMILPRSIVQLNTFHIPDHVPDAHAAILEPLISVVHGQRRIAIQQGETVVIVGAGGAISLLHLQISLLSGASRVIGVGHSDTRLQIFSQMGGSDVINTHQASAVDQVLELTGGRGADVVIECAGSSEAWESAVQMARKGGRVLWFGGLPTGTILQIDPGRVHYGEMSLLGVHGGTLSDAQEAYRLLVSGDIDPSLLISGTCPLDKIEEAFQRMIDGSAIKMAIIPG